MKEDKMKTLSEILSRDKKNYFKVNNLIASLNMEKKGIYPSISQNQPGNQKKHNILVVDDSMSTVSLINDTLKDYYNILVAFSGEEAIKILEKHTPDLVLLDVIMPGMDGYELCNEIKSNKRFDFIKIIMISGETKLQNRLKGFEAGADDYITKPIEIMELLAKVKVFSRLTDVEDQLRVMNEHLNEQVKMQSIQLIEAEKLTALGQHTACMVHSLNNPLQALIAYAELINLDCPDNGYIQNMIKAAESINDMVRTISLSSSRERCPHLVEVDLNKIIIDQLEFMKMDHFFKTCIGIKLKLQAIPTFRGVYSHFSQSIGSLIKNATEAMYDSDKRTLEITTSCDDEVIHINITDTGCGIKEEELEKIFDPFFTTKPLFNANVLPAGTGIGLTSAKEMIESYNGKIVVASEPGVGSTFRICLPIKE